MYDRLQEDMKQALKEHDKIKLDTIRMVISSIKQIHIDEKKEINDELVTKVLSKEIKTRKESLEEFKKASRDDLIEKAQSEIDILTSYMPSMLSEDELNKIIEDVFKEVKPSSIKDMGKIMKEVTSKAQGRADMSNVSSLVKEKLSNL